MRLLGVTNQVDSPTFVIDRRYTFPLTAPWRTLIHSDYYRLNSTAELRALNWPELLAEPEHLLAIEWAEKVLEALPADRLHLHFSHHGDGARRVSWHVLDYD